MDTKHHHWTDGLFTMTCKVCGETFAKFYDAVAHVDAHTKEEKEKKNE